MLISYFLITFCRRSHSQDVFAVSDLSPTQLQDSFNVWTREEEKCHTVEEHPDEGAFDRQAPYDRFSHTPSSAHLMRSHSDPVEDEDDEEPPDQPHKPDHSFG